MIWLWFVFSEYENLQKFFNLCDSGCDDSMSSHVAYLQIDNPARGRTAAYENVQNNLSQIGNSATSYLKPFNK